MRLFRPHRMRSAQSRRSAHDAGLVAETRAEMHMRDAGYRTLARRYRTSVGEVDIIMEDGTCVVFLEVKVRGECSMNDAIVTHRQRRRISNAASVFVANNPQFTACDMRFDVMVVDEATGKMEHIRNAW